jgi:hypothetical protein
VLKIKKPLAPDDPAFIVEIETVPLVLAVPSPLAKDKLPPVLTVLRPE